MTDVTTSAPWNALRDRATDLMETIEGFAPLAQAIGTAAEYAYAENAEMGCSAEDAAADAATLRRLLDHLTGGVGTLTVEVAGMYQAIEAVAG